MSDQKSKLPDFKEITSFTSKLFNDIKDSVCEIVEEYKSKRKQTEKPANGKAKPETKQKPPKEEDSNKPQ